jgi:hypothetical protein
MAKEPIHMAREAIHTAKEPCSYGKRALFIWQKSPVHMAKEAYVHYLTDVAGEASRVPKVGPLVLNGALDYLRYTRNRQLIWGIRTYMGY